MVNYVLVFLNDIDAVTLFNYALGSYIDDVENSYLSNVVPLIPFFCCQLRNVWVCA